MDISIIYTTEYSRIARIHDALYSYNLSKTGARREDVHAQQLPEAAALIIQGADGTFYGGVGYHFLNDPRRIYVDYLFLDDALRGQGWGQKLFAELEKRVTAEGAESITLTTNTFQAPGFYEKIGFEKISEKAAPVPLLSENIHYTYYKKTAIAN